MFGVMFINLLGGIGWLYEAAKLIQGIGFYFSATVYFVYILPSKIFLEDHNIKHIFMDACFVSSLYFGDINAVMQIVWCLAECLC